MSDDPRPAARGFYHTGVTGQVTCRLCDRLDHAHTPDCPVYALSMQLRELSGEFGQSVATMREIIDALDRLLQGEGDAPWRIERP